MARTPPNKDRLTVLFAHEAFYTALAQGDLEVMRQLWSTEEPVSCIHPGWPPLVGQKAVMESWQHISARPPSIRASNATLLAYGDDLIMVICREVVDDTVLAANNLFRRDAEGWRLCHHQAGPTAEEPGSLTGTAEEEDDALH